MPTALIVEDEPEANRLLSMLVQFRGYRTESALTGNEALAKIDRESPDIVFLDLMLPDINGYEICETLKKDKATALIPVVIVTARVAVENRIQSYCVGADHYVPKPYTPEQIFQAIVAADDRQRQIDRHAVEGEIRIETDDEGESLRQLAQLRSVLIARTPLDFETVCRLSESLRHLVDLAENWGAKQGASKVAVLKYHTLPDCVTLTLHDRAGWFRDDPDPPEARWADVIARGGFDELSADPSSHDVTFVKRFLAGQATEPRRP
jgi:DNA-binding response OmpR family regulator